MDKKKLGMTIFFSICAIIIVVCIIIQVIVNNETKELEKESEKLDTFVTTTTSGTEIETEYIRVEDNKFFIKVPTSFKQLDAETISQKYSGDVPGVIFSNEETTINVAINMTDNDMKNDGIENYKTYMEGLLKENNGEVISSNYYEVDNHNVGQIKLISDSQDSKIYSNTIFFSYNDKLVIITFNCTSDSQEEWQGVGDFIIDSLFFTD